MAIQTRAGPAISRSGSGLPSRVVIHGVEGCGKCLGKDTPVLMYDGTIKAVQDVEFGDQLMGPDSKPRTVLGVNSGFSELYKVTPTKGDPYVVNGCHVLSLKMSRRSGGEFHRVVNISVEHYLRQTACFRRDALGWRSAVHCWPERELPIDPYLLGCWLGDGTAGQPDITTPDVEVLDAMEEYSSQAGLKVKVRAFAGAATTYAMVGKHGGHPKNRINPFTTALAALGVLKDKRIPHEYKTSSREQRLAILAGLIDSDGCVANGCCDFISKSKDLAEDLAFVARSLGFACYVKPCVKVCTNSPTRASGTYYRASISGDLSVIPSRVPRRIAQPRKQIKDVLVTGIQVDPIGYGEYFGFELDGDHLFLLGDFTVTHNTSLAAFTPRPVFSMTRGETGLLTLIDNALVGPTDHFDEAVTWQELLEQVRWLIAGDHQNKTYAIDTLNGAERLCFEHVTREKFNGNPESFLAYGKGPEIAQAEWIKLLLLLDELRAKRRMSIMLLCHTRIKTFRNPDGDDFDRYCPDLHEKVWGLTHKWADVVLFANFEQFAKKDRGALKAKGVGGDDRILYTQRTAAYDAKNRLGLPDHIRLGQTPQSGWLAFAEAMKSARLRASQAQPSQQNLPQPEPETASTEEANS